MMTGVLDRWMQVEGMPLDNISARGHHSWDQLLVPIATARMRYSGADGTSPTSAHIQLTQDICSGDELK